MRVGLVQMSSGDDLEANLEAARALVAEAAERGVVLDERAGEGLRLLEKMTEPSTAASLAALLDRADQLEHLSTLSEAAPAAIATVVDIFDDEYARALENGHDPEQALRQAAGALGQLSELFRSEEFDALLHSGVLEPQALRVIGSLGSALVASQKEAQRGATSPKGLFGLLSALRDPDVQHAVGFLTSVAKKFGRNLQD